MQLTVGFSTTNDPGAWWTLNVFNAMHRDLDHEFLILDNSPAGSKQAAELERHVKQHRNVRYFRDTDPPSSCLYKGRLFAEAAGEAVVCLDSHVFLEPSTIPAILAYFADPAHSKDLVTGPIQNAAGNVMATNQHLYASEPYEVPKDAVVRHGVVCRGGQLGVWVTDPRGLNPAGEPFEVIQQGLGFFAMRKDAFPGYHPSFVGFGGSEPYVTEKVRQNGGKVVCHPAVRWTHNFSEAHGRGYKALAEDKIRNYLVAARLLERQDLYLATVEHFATAHPGVIGTAVAAADNVIAGRPAKPEPKAAEPLGEGPGAELVAIFKSLNMPTCQQCYALARRMNAWGPAGCREHMAEIIDDMLPRARDWYEKATPWMKAEAWFQSQGSIWSKLKSAAATAHDTELALRESILRHVLEAIRRSEASRVSDAA